MNETTPDEAKSPDNILAEPKSQDKAPDEITTTKVSQEGNKNEVGNKSKINKNSSMFLVKRGDLFFADLTFAVGSEQGGVRPVLVIQNDIGNRFSPTVTVAPITGQIHKAKLPTHVELKAGSNSLDRDSVILLEQLRTIDKSRLIEKVTQDLEVMRKVDDALMIQVGVIDF